MPDSLSPHPNDSTLRSHVLFGVDGDKAGVIGVHLDQCPDCRARAEAITSGPNPDGDNTSAPAPPTGTIEEARTLRANARDRALLRGSEGAGRFEIGEGG